ncbi:DNA repair protein RecO [bacterium]|nr:DNA repair protein RecO [bacterium]
MQAIPAIVLGTSPYSETTLIVRLLTSHHGVVRALAKGARRKGKQSQAAFEPLTRVQAMIKIKGPDALATLGEVTVRGDWPWLHKDLNRLAFASLGIEAIGAAAALHPPEPVFYELAREFLERMGEARGPGSLTIALLMRLLHETGFPPRVAEDWTAETLPARLAWDFAAGMFRVGEAREAVQTGLAAPAVAALMPWMNEPPDLKTERTIPSSLGEPIIRWLVRVWEDHLGRPLNSARFIEKMLFQ